MYGLALIDRSLTILPVTMPSITECGTTMEYEYLMLDGDDWSMSAKLSDGANIPPRAIGSESLSELLQHLLDHSQTMTFDEHPRIVRRVDIDFEHRTVKLSA
jgi:hypothetical protein